MERLEKDFMNNQKFCYRCVYRIKVEKNSKIKPPYTFKCRACRKEVTHRAGEKKRQRTVYCSYECAEIAHNKQINNHWTKKIHVTDVCNLSEEDKWIICH